MSQLAEIVENSLLADERFRHLTVMPPVWTVDLLERTEREADELWSKIRFIVDNNYEKYWD